MTFNAKKARTKYALPLWVDASEMKRLLVADGWVSPDTYDNFFEPVSDISAVYLFLIHEREEYRRAFVAYVGMSETLSQRFSGHEILKELDGTDCWPMRWFRPVPAEDLRAVERSYIERFDPPWNIIGRRRGVVLHG